MYCLLLELATGARDEQRLTGAACALGLAGALSGAPLASLAWRRACALSKPQATLASAPPPPAGGAPLLPLNLSHEGRLLAVAFLPPPAPAARCLGVDVMSAARGASALKVAAASGDCAGEALLRGCSGGRQGGGRSDCAPARLPTPRALAGAAAAPARLFAARWTLMEAVLKARGQGLAVQGAGAAVLAEAVEEAEEEAEAGGRAGAASGSGAGAEALAPALWGARAPAGGWDTGSAQRAAEVAAAAAAAAAVATAAAAASDGEAALQRVPYAVLARFRGPGWRAVTCALSWPTPGADTLLTFALLD